MSENHLNPPGSEAGTVQTPVYKTKKKNVPVKDNDFGELCTSVSKRWKEMPKFNLLHISREMFEEKATLFNSMLNNSLQAAGNRSPLTLRLQKADATMDQGIRAVKIYLKEKYEGSAPAYYALFGLEWHNSAYKLPYDRNKRRNVLNQILSGISTEGFGDKKYGTAFWTDLTNEYNSLLDTAIKTDGLKSSNIGNKKLLKEELSTALNAIISLIRAQYPGNAASELRNWGFQKDKY